MIPSNTISWCSSMTQFSSSSGNCVACRTTLLLAMHDPSWVSTLRLLATEYCLQCLGRHLREMKVILTLSQQTPLLGCMIALLRLYYPLWCLAARAVHWSARLLRHTLDCWLPHRLQYGKGIFDCGVKYGKGLSNTVANVSLPATNYFFAVVILTAALEGALNHQVGCCGQTGQVMQKIGDCFCCLLSCHLGCCF